MHVFHVCSNFELRTFEPHAVDFRALCSMRLLGRSMRVGDLVVAALLSAIPSARGWHCASRPHFCRSSCGSRVRRVEDRPIKRGAIMSSADTIDVDKLWPSLAGRQTCANEAAGKVSSAA